MFALPSRLTFGPLGGAGSPATMLGLAMLAWWVYYQVGRSAPTGAGPQPVRTGLFFFLAAVAISYVVAMTRAIDPDEASTAQLGPIVLLAWAGVLLVLNDGIPNRARLRDLLAQAGVRGGRVGDVGVIQFVTGETLVDRITIPGLSLNQPLGGFTSRGGFNRPPGTTLHAIEYGSVLTMILPIALNVAITDRTARRSSSVVSGGHRGFCHRRRHFALRTHLCRTRGGDRDGGVGATRPPHGGCCPRSLLLARVPHDPRHAWDHPRHVHRHRRRLQRATSRVDSYAIAGGSVCPESGVLAGGFSTFLPQVPHPRQPVPRPDHRGDRLSRGSSRPCWRCCWRRCGALEGLDEWQPITRPAARRHFASVVAGGTGLAFYDGLGFPSAGVTLFIVLGLAGALWRLVREEAADRTRTVTRESPGEARSRTPLPQVLQGES